MQSTEDFGLVFIFKPEFGKRKETIEFLIFCLKKIVRFVSKNNMWTFPKSKEAFEHSLIH